MEKIRINGLKLSDELALLHLEMSSDVSDPLAEVCRLLGDHHINILFMSTAAQSHQKYGICCIESDQTSFAKELISKNSGLLTAVSVKSGVGLVTLFPHQSSLKMVGVVLEKLSGHHIPIYGLASSIAAITVVTDYHHLDHAAQVLAQALNLPQEAAPMRSAIKVKPKQR